ncbi:MULTISPECIES: ABC transporter ATP-binding protein [Kitasatospora]|nr:MULTISPECIES: ABC transporter ATP-binding protein [Kitasatospora]
MRFRDGWALRGCDFTVPAGRISGVVGPNGAGKSTLLALAAGQLAPSEGGLLVFGEPADAPGPRARVAYVAQDKPLYAGLTVAETLRMGRELNPVWDQEAAQRVVEQGELRPRARIGSLSGGQRTRVSLALALGKRADLLLLDEPMADLDPLARHQLMGTLMSAVAEHGTTVVVSSHVLAELDGVIDHLLLVQRGGIRLAGDLEDVLDGHRLLTGPAGADGPPAELVVERRVTGRLATALVRTGRAGAQPGGAQPGGEGAGWRAEGWESERPGLEELLLGYLRGPVTPAATAGTAATGTAAAGSTEAGRTATNDEKAA